jgi:hypothetical protein
MFSRLSRAALTLVLFAAAALLSGSTTNEMLCDGFFETCISQDQYENCVAAEMNQVCHSICGPTFYRAGWCTEEDFWNCDGGPSGACTQS